MIVPVEPEEAQDAVDVVVDVEVGNTAPKTSRAIQNQVFGSVREMDRRSGTGRLQDATEPPWTDEEHDHDQHEEGDQDVLLADVGRRHGFDAADEERSGDRAADAAEPPQHGDHQPLTSGTYPASGTT